MCRLSSSTTASKRMSASSTIQKLASMLKNKTYEDEVKAITQKQIVFIFDECHRSQFGDMHTLITKKFKHRDALRITLVDRTSNKTHQR